MFARASVVCGFKSRRRSLRRKVADHGYGYSSGSYGQQVLVPIHHFYCDLYVQPLNFWGIAAVRGSFPVAIASLDRRA